MDHYRSWCSYNPHICRLQVKCLLGSKGFSVTARGEHSDGISQIHQRHDSVAQGMLGMRNLEGIWVPRSLSLWRCGGGCGEGRGTTAAMAPDLRNWVRSSLWTLT